MTLSPPSSVGLNGVTISDAPSAGEVLTADSATAASWQAASGGLAVLFNSTLGADAAIIDSGAGGVAGTSTSLVVRMLLRTDEVAATSSALIRVNGDSGGNYDRSTVDLINATLTGAPTSGATSWPVRCAGASSLATIASPVVMVIPFYTATTFLKTCVINVGAGGDTATEMFAQYIIGSYRTVSAITRISVAPGGGTVLLAGSRLQVLGSV